MFEHKVALVTGGARRIGKAITLRLAKAGYAVAIHCNTGVADAEDLAAAIKADGGRAAVISADLADPLSVDAIMPAATAELGPVTFLVNNASMFVSDSVTAIDVPTWNRQFSVNIRAPSVLAGALANALPHGIEGAIVNILDQRVWKLTPEYYSYTLSKAAMWAATRTMAQAFAPRIRVNAVGPGPAIANIHDGETLFAQEAAGTLLGRPVPPEDIADAVLYLATARSVTGQMLAVDSGQHLAWRTPDIVTV
ncbi:MAG: SDR family oxidoreductase [Hyphomicrobiales bacterium]|jgi:NAD(P)-dependent dehydrogenase (short-subunit alcohol dehydrogenase family)|nr:SDR family oxidoreductase [Hyphomicrobiales bacterium]